MIKEYCDKCKKEIPGEDREKKIVQISFPRKSYTGYDQCECAKLTLWYCLNNYGTCIRSKREKLECQTHKK